MSEIRNELLNLLHYIQSEEETKTVRLEMLLERFEIDIKTQLEDLERKEKKLKQDLEVLEYVKKELK